MRAPAVAIAFLILLPVAASAQSPDGGTLIRSVDEPAQALRVTKRLPSSGLPAFATATGKGILVRAPEGAPAVERALAFLDGYGKSFGIADRASVRLLREERRDKVGMEHVRFQQIHRGVPVTGGEIVIHIRGARVVVVSARIVLVPNIDIAPRLKPSQATAAAAKVVAGLRGKFSPKIKYSTPRLEIFNRAHLGGRPLPTRLTWFVVASGPELNEYIWVDAQTGEVLLHFNQFPDARQREIFSTSTSTEDDPCGVATATSVGGEGNPPSGEVFANAFRFAGYFYDYFWQKHERDSYDGAGGTLSLNVIDCLAAPFGSCRGGVWDDVRRRACTGDRYLADDVVGHEFTHGLTQRAAGLFYFMQSGALHESFSDIFGEMIDQTFSNGGAADRRWLLAEDWPSSDPGSPTGAIRSMSDPNLHAHPASMSDPYYYCGDDSGIFVHTNSGVPNHGFQLMSDGSAGGRGIGTDKSARIFYRALTTYLMSSSDFSDLFAALNQSCLDLTGLGGITADDCTQVSLALDVVELNHPAPCDVARAPRMCASPNFPQYLFFDDFEAPTLANWTRTVATGTQHWSATPTTDYAASGLQSAHAVTSPERADSALEMTTGVTLPPGAMLQVTHAFGFDRTGDGGVVEFITAMPGLAWTDAGSLFFTGTPYNETLNPSNPLSGREAFSGVSFGFTNSRYNLSSLAGQTVRFRFRTATNSAHWINGWYIDDVIIYRCLPPQRVVETEEVSLEACLREQCREAELGPGEIQLECDQAGCIVVDNVDKNCRFKYPCPGCGVLCPPYYHMYFDGLGDAWKVGLFTTSGKPVPHEQFATRTGLVVSFRPDKENYIEGKIGKYALAFKMTPAGKPGVRYKIKARLERSDRPYKP